MSDPAAQTCKWLQAASTLPRGIRPAQAGRIRHHDRPYSRTATPSGSPPSSSANRNEKPHAPPISCSPTTTAVSPAGNSAVTRS